MAAGRHLLAYRIGDVQWSNRGTVRTQVAVAAVAAVGDDGLFDADVLADGGTERRFGNGATLMFRLTNRFALEDVADVCGTD